MFHAILTAITLLLAHNLQVVAKSQDSYLDDFAFPSQLLSPFGIFIVGGVKVTDPTEYPFLVRIVQWENSRPRFICGGSIISKNEVVTAAHCVDNISSTRKPYEQFYVVAGCLTPLFGTAPNAAETDTCDAKDVETFRIHPNYSKSKYNITNDVAVLSLKDNFNLSEYIQPIQLPQSNERFEDVFENEVITAGWGLTARADEPIQPGNNSPEDLHSLTYQVLTHGACTNITETSSGVLCAQLYEDPLAGTRNGDSGGPLVCKMKGTNNSNERYLCGITSHSRLGETLDVFMDVSWYSKWILYNETDTDSDKPISEFNYRFVISVVIVFWTLFVVIVGIAVYRLVVFKTRVRWEERLVP